VVADALSGKEKLDTLTMSKELFQEFEKLSLEVYDSKDAREFLNMMTFQPELQEKI
jgi:DNA polymerase III epsilon subunit-like protein